ncbi:hypothetical protein C8Q76DRAFT_861347 [Earliella scabrosa]|nr:hypothetical protein C8Q76DRAFT_861347 [Earliella scabrosa]
MYFTTAIFVKLAVAVAAVNAAATLQARQVPGITCTTDADCTAIPDTTCVSAADLPLPLPVDVPGLCLPSIPGAGSLKARQLDGITCTTSADCTAIPDFDTCVDGSAVGLPADVGGICLPAGIAGGL